jgi:hypothetical protein
LQTTPSISFYKTFKHPFRPGEKRQKLHHYPSKFESLSSSIPASSSSISIRASASAPNALPQPQLAPTSQHRPATGSIAPPLTCSCSSRPATHRKGFLRTCSLRPCFPNSPARAPVQLDLLTWAGAPRQQPQWRHLEELGRSHNSSL